MKRVLCLVFAAAMLFAVGCSNKKSSGNDPVVIGEPHTADGKNYDNTVSYVDGELSGTDFNWNYFAAKAGSGRGSEVSIVITENGWTKTVSVSFDGVSYTVKDGDSVGFYKYLVSFEAEGMSFAVLTDEASMTAETFFGGASSSSVRIGQSNSNGMLVFAKKK